MEPTKRTKFAAGLLALALGALVLDRVTGGPASVQGAIEPPSPADAQPRAGEPSTGKAGAGAHGAITDRLEQLRPSPAGDHESLDAFVAPAAWFPPPDEHPKSEKKHADQSALHHLKSIQSIKNSDSGDEGRITAAVIDDHFVSVGKSFDLVNDSGVTTTVKLLEATMTGENTGTAKIEINGDVFELKLESRKEKKLDITVKPKPDVGPPAPSGR